MHKTYFKEPVYGVLTDQAATIASREKATYPRFETYTRQFRIKDMYKGVDYEGGLAFEGANVKGKGENAFPAKINLYRNDTLFIKITAKDFLFSSSGLNSQETAATLYLGKDSIYHSNLGFSFQCQKQAGQPLQNKQPGFSKPLF